MSRHYICLPKESLKIGGFSLVTVQDEHIESIRQWRNAQIDVLRQAEPITPEQQKRYFQEHIWPTLDTPHPKQILLSFLEEDQLIGYGGLVHIAWEHLRAEVSFLLNPSLSADIPIFRRYLALYLDLTKQLAFSTLGLHRLHTETYAIRTDFIQELEANGFRQEGRMRDHVHIGGSPVDALIHGCLHGDN